MIDDRYINRCDRSTRERYLSMDDDRRREVDQKFARHALACEKCGIRPEPGFLCELMSEMARENILV